MPCLYLPQLGAFVRMTLIGLSGQGVARLPEIGFPFVGNYLTMLAHPHTPPNRAALIDPQGAGNNDPSHGTPLSIPDAACCHGTGPSRPPRLDIDGIFHGQGDCG